MKNLITKKFIFGVLLTCSLTLASLACRSTKTPESLDANAANDSANGVDDATPARADASDAAMSGSAELIAKGVKLFEEYRNDEAMQAYKSALELDPDSGEAHYRIGLVYADAGDKEAAEKSYKEAVERLEKRVRKNEEDASAYRYLAQAHAKLGDHADAVKALRQLVKLQPDESYHHYELGLALGKLALYPEAVQSLKKATQLDPDNFRAIEALERAQEGAKRREIALKRQEEEQRRLDPASNRAREQNSNLVAAPPSLAPSTKQN